MSGRDYWERYGRTFADLYARPTAFDRCFRRGLYLRAKMAIDVIRQTPGATVLDVGCGPGRNSVLFIKEGGAARVVGIDLADDMLAMARDLAARHGVADRCEFVRGDFLSADLDGETFDCAAALGVMDYFRDPVPLLRRMREVSRRAAMASFPGFAPVRMALRKARYAVRGCGVYWFWKSEIQRMFADAGFADSCVQRCTLAGWFATGRPPAAADAAGP